MQKIAYVCADPGIPVFGIKGAAIHVQSVIGQLLKRGFEVDLFSPRVEGLPPSNLGTAKLKVHRLPGGEPHGSAADRELSCTAANRDLAEALEASGPYDLVYERYSIWSHAGLETARQRGWPSVIEVNAPLIEEAARHFTLVHRELAQQSMERALNAAGHIVAVSREVAQAIGRPSAVVVPNGVDHERFRPDIAPSRPSPLFTVGFVGNFRPWHGLDVLADCMGRLQDTRLLAVGDGPERTMLETLKQAELTGRVRNEDVPALLASMDVAVCPYPDIAGFYYSPLKLFEYMAAGVPVVASRIGQIPQIISQGQTGLLVPPGDPAALAEAIKRLKQDQGLSRRIAAAAREQAIAAHSWERVVERILSLPGLHP